jgi:hypothetical protein
VSRRGSRPALGLLVSWSDHSLHAREPSSATSGTPREGIGIINRHHRSASPIVARPTGVARRRASSDAQRASRRRNPDRRARTSALAENGPMTLPRMVQAGIVDPRVRVATIPAQSIPSGIVGLPGGAGMSLAQSGEDQAVMSHERSWLLRAARTSRTRVDEHVGRTVQVVQAESRSAVTSSDTARSRAGRSAEFATPYDYR